MPCRHQQCHSRCTSHASCCHNQNLRHSVAIQVSVPSVSTLCCPPTPSSMRSQGTSYEDFCTSETCKDSELICVETLPPHYLFDTLNKKGNVCKPCQQENDLENGEKSHINPLADTTKSDPKLIQYKDAATSPRISLLVGPSLPTLKIYDPEPLNENSDNADKTESQLDTRKDASIRRAYSSQACTSESKIRLPGDSYKQSYNSLSERKGNNSKQALENKFSTISSGIKKTHCPAIKKTISDQMIPTPKPSILQEKRSSLPDNKIKESIGIPCSMCTSKKCTKTESTNCQCRYPPAFSQFGCSGKIVGNCECDK
ncbi:uncharacterized protein LOC115454778 isoform X2 [Manduca sexta]|nr:uncharacterized protein LOC115454778 isoform X2 [Manduca sexta]